MDDFYLFCERCGLAFEPHATIHKYYPATRIDPSEEYYLCPICEAELIDGKHCVACSGWTYEDDYCDDCQKICRNKLQEFMNKFKREYGQDLVNCMDYITSGNYLSDYVGGETDAKK